MTLKDISTINRMLGTIQGAAYKTPAAELICDCAEVIADIINKEKVSEQ